MWVELQGPADERGMLIDFKEIKTVLATLVEAWDHGVLVAETDTVLLDAMALLKSKHYVLPYDTTSENICQFIINYLAEHALDVLIHHQVSSVRVKLQETETCFAEHEVSVSTLREESELKNKSEATVV
ncbi:hypothetical protein GCM10028895_47570 [Pontibacter rugosus]